MDIGNNRGGRQRCMPYGELHICGVFNEIGAFNRQHDMGLTSECRIDVGGGEGQIELLLGNMGLDALEFPPYPSAHLSS